MKNKDYQSFGQTKTVPTKTQETQEQQDQFVAKRQDLILY